MAAAKEKDDGTFIVPFVRALVTRGYDVVSADVLPSEVPVLKVVHGEDNVRVDDGEDPGTVRISTSAEMELARLRRKYSRIGDDDAVRYAYPAGVADLKAFGFVSGGDVADRDQAVIKVRKPEAK